MNQDDSTNKVLKKHRDTLQRLNALENAINRKLVEKRRRMSALMDIMPEYRKTLAQIYISATYEKFSEPIMKQHVVKETVTNPVIQPINPTIMQAGYNPMFSGVMQPPVQLLQQQTTETRTTIAERQVKGKWKLLIEGRVITPSIDIGDSNLDDADDTNNRESENQINHIKFTHLFDTLCVKPKGGDMLEWKKESGTSDAHAFSVELDDHYAGNSDLVVDVELHASTPESTEYIPSPALVKVLFPNMKDIVPITLTQFHDNLFGYITKHRLQDPSDLSIINNNQVLEELFGCKRMLFSAVSGLISSQKLLIPINSDNLINPKTFPIALKRCNMMTVAEGTTGVFVPVLFHGHVRSLMMRIKRKEQEYFSLRTKVSRMLTPSNTEESLKQSIERCVSGKGKVGDTQTYLALVKAAPKDSEVQKIGQIDVRLLDLWSRVETHNSLSKGNRKVAELILEGAYNKNSSIARDD